MLRNLLGGRRHKPIVLNESGTMTGALACSQPIVVRGQLSGRIDAPKLIVERGGHVVGDAVVKHLVVAGTMIGRVSCEHARFETGAKFYGVLRYDHMQIAEGASVTGNLVNRTRTGPRSLRLISPASEPSLDVWAQESGEAGEGKLLENDMLAHEVLDGHHRAHIAAETDPTIGVDLNDDADEFTSAVSDTRPSVDEVNRLVDEVPSEAEALPGEPQPEANSPPADGILAIELSNLAVSTQSETSPVIAPAPEATKTQSADAPDAVLKTSQPVDEEDLPGDDLRRLLGGVKASDWRYRGD